MEDYNTRSGIFKKTVNAGMDNTSPSTRILKGWHLSKKLSTFPKNSAKYLLMKELESYCGTIDNTIYAYVKNYRTCSGIFS